MCGSYLVNHLRHHNGLTVGCPIVYNYSGHALYYSAGGFEFEPLGVISPYRLHIVVSKQGYQLRPKPPRFTSEMD